MNHMFLAHGKSVPGWRANSGGNCVGDAWCGPRLFHDSYVIDEIVMTRPVSLINAGAAGAPLGAEMSRRDNLAPVRDSGAGGRT